MDIRFESIEWLRETMKTISEYKCRCGKEFFEFDSWWNHMIISKHIIMTEEDIQVLRDFVAKI